VHAHGLRHTYDAELAREGTAINVIRDALGHTSLAVTDRYSEGSGLSGVLSEPGHRVTLWMQNVTPCADGRR